MQPVVCDSNLVLKADPALPATMPCIRVMVYGADFHYDGWLWDQYDLEPDLAIR